MGLLTVVGHFSIKTPFFDGEVNPKLETALDPLESNLESIKSEPCTKRRTPPGTPESTIS
jgi:hypothetical protein